MPVAIPAPSLRSDDWGPWLAANNLHVTTPPIRSSDWSTVSSDPFSYLLHRRLSLASPLSYSRALSRGSWFHTRAEFFFNPLPLPSIRAALSRLLLLRLAELTATCNTLGIVNESRASILERETRDCAASCAWFENALELPVPTSSGTPHPLRDHFSHFRVLSIEPRLCARLPGHSATCLLAQPDALLYHTRQHLLYALDWKTCSETATTRLASCPIDFQSRHYPFVLHSILPLLISTYSLDPSTTIGGMYHVALQKPTIDFGMNDRPFTLDTSPFKSGPRAGTPRNEKIYSGEPSYPLYLARVRRWYLALDEYSHLSSSRTAGDILNVSRLTPEVLDKDTLPEYLRQLSTIYEHAIAEPRPTSFPRSSSGVTDRYGRLTPFAPFYLTDPSAWPEVCARHGFAQIPRDPDLDPASVPPTGLILETPDALTRSNVPLPDPRHPTEASAPSPFSQARQEGQTLA